MKKALKFVAPVKDSTQSGTRREVYEQSIELYEQQHYIEALHTLLDYLNPEFRHKYGDAQGLTFRIPHGSIIVDIRIADERLNICADFLTIPEKGRVAMLRQVADMNINKLRLPYFIKEGNKLKIAYSCPIAETHPHKIYGVLSNICHIGDRYDDEFCTKFGAERCYEPEITPYAAETVERIHAEIQSLGESVREAVKEYNAQRKYRYSWHVLFTFYYQIGYFAMPQGQLANDLDNILSAMDEELQYVELVNRGMEYLDRLLAMSQEELAGELYYVDTLVSSKRPSSLQNIQENFEDVYNEATEAMQAQDFEHAVLRITFKFYEAYAFNDMQDDLNAVIVSALRKASEAPMDVAAEALWTAMDKIMEGDLIPDIDLEDIVKDNPAAQAAMEQASAGIAAAQQAMNGDEMQALQQRMMEAMSRGDMAEYMRIAGQMQQLVMKGMFNN